MIWGKRWTTHVVQAVVQMWSGLRNVAANPLVDERPRGEPNEGGDAPAGAFVEVRATYSVPRPRGKHND